MGLKRHLTLTSLLNEEVELKMHAILGRLNSSARENLCIIKVEYRLCIPDLSVNISMASYDVRQQVNVIPDPKDSYTFFLPSLLEAITDSSGRNIC